MFIIHPTFLLIIVVTQSAVLGEKTNLQNYNDNPQTLSPEKYDFLKHQLRSNVSVVQGLAKSLLSDEPQHALRGSITNNGKLVTKTVPVSYNQAVARVGNDPLDSNLVNNIVNNTEVGGFSRGQDSPDGEQIKAQNVIQDHTKTTPKVYNVIEGQDKNVHEHKEMEFNDNVTGFVKQLTKADMSSYRERPMAVSKEGKESKLTNTRKLPLVSAKYVNIPSKGHTTSTKSGGLHKVDNPHLQPDDFEKVANISGKNKEESESDPTTDLKNSEFANNKTIYKPLKASTEINGNQSKDNTDPESTTAMYDNTKTVFVENVNKALISKGVRMSQNDTMDGPAEDNDVASSEINKGITDSGHTTHETTVETEYLNKYENNIRRTSEQSKVEHTRLRTPNHETTEGKHGHHPGYPGSVVTVEQSIKTNSDETSGKSTRSTTLSTIFRTIFMPVTKFVTTGSKQSNRAKNASVSASQIAGKKIETVPSLQQTGIPSTSDLNKITFETKLISTIEQKIRHTKSGLMKLQPFTIKDKQATRTYHTTAIVGTVNNDMNVDMVTAKTDYKNVQLKENKPPEHVTIPCNLSRHGNYYDGSSLAAAAAGGAFVGGILVLAAFYCKQRFNRYLRGDYNRVPMEYDFELNPRLKYP